MSGITTSSVFVSWTEPVGISGSYRVEWTNGSVSERTATQHTHVNITDLTPGGHYTFSVKTLTCNQTEGNTVSESFYTSKYLEQHIWHLSIPKTELSHTFLFQGPSVYYVLGGPP